MSCVDSNVLVDVSSSLFSLVITSVALKVVLVDVLSSLLSLVITSVAPERILNI